MIGQFGIPTVSDPIGVMDSTQIPVALTFATKAYDHSNLFRCAFSFEFAWKLRQRPGRTPSLDTDTISRENGDRTFGSLPPELSAKVKSMESEDGRMIQMSGTYGTDNGKWATVVTSYVDGEEVKQVQLKDRKWESETKVLH